MLTAACGSSDLASLCGDAEECARKAGTPFSRTECENNAKSEKEKYDTAGCGDQYGDYASCVTGLNFECSDNAGNKIAAECGREVKALADCID